MVTIFFIFFRWFEKTLHSIYIVRGGRKEGISWLIYQPYGIMIVRVQGGYSMCLFYV